MVIFTGPQEMNGSPASCQYKEEDAAALEDRQIE